MIDIDVEIDESATPAVAAVADALADRTPLHEAMAPVLENTVRDHLIAIEPVMHKTAQRLGAKPTGYLARRARQIESSADASAAIVTIGGSVEIFARVAGPVLVRPQVARHLTIPATSLAYGRRAREITGLRFVRFANGTKALAAIEGKGKERKLTVHYWLQEQVTLPQERNLLPSDSAMIAAMELGAVQYLETLQPED